MMSFLNAVFSTHCVTKIHLVKGNSLHFLKGFGLEKAFCELRESPFEFFGTMKPSGKKEIKFPLHIQNPLLFLNLEMFENLETPTWAVPGLLVHS